MDEIRELYQEVILDHNKNPRNFHVMENADAELEGYNPLCGDHYTFYVRYDDSETKRIAEVSFTGNGCAISKASASIMSAFIKGKTKDEAEHYFNLFHDIVVGKKSAADHIEELGKLAAFAGVSEFPMRVKCATLPWHTLHGAITGEDTTISTE
ncbi:MAG: SUF system NifU family Fe-S cluster assembly protein [Ectothiorhodospiraceae bacterium]|nr:SUF system NifU family Fe-S cluster assembly protein [Ectothiorhodospiraceae bacterium]